MAILCATDRLCITVSSRPVCTRAWTPPETLFCSRSNTQSYRLFSDWVSVWVYGGLPYVARIASRIQISLPGFMLSFWWRLFAPSRLPETSFSTWFPSTPPWDFLSPLVLLRHQNYSPRPFPQVPLMYFYLLMNQRDLLWNVR